MREQKMAAPEVIIKCEEFLENDVHPAENDTYFNAYENHENDQENCPENGDNENDNDYEEDDDTKMQELLREFDLEILYTILKIGDITYRSLKYISENDINAAIRSIAYRAEFREKLFAWRRDKYGLNDYSVLPPSRNSVTPLGVNNSNNIQAFYTNNHNHNHNSNPPSNRAPSCNSMVSSMPNIKPQQKQPTVQIPPRRRLSNSKMNSAKRPRIHQNQEKSMNQVNNVQHPSQLPTPQQQQQPPPPLSPIQNSCRLSAQQQQYTQGDRSPTPPLTEPMTILHQDTSRLDAHQTMDYDDPLCYQPTTSSAAAAAAGSANTPTLASLKQDDSSPYTTPQPKMSYEKLEQSAASPSSPPPPPEEISAFQLKAKILSGEYKLSPKEGRSRLWTVFGIIATDRNKVIPGYVACRTCRNVYKHHSNSTSNLVRHRCYVSHHSLRLNPNDSNTEVNESIDYE